MNNEAPDIAAAAPTTLNHVIASGANLMVKERIRVALESCYATGEPFPHALLVGSKGVGKTLYSQVVSYECGESKPLVVLGQTLREPAAVNGLLLSLEEKAICTIDEVHTLSVDGQHCLLRALENREIFLAGTGTRRRPLTVKLPPFTLIGATTDEHLLIPPLLDRFRLILRLVPYSSTELAELLRQRAQTLRWQVAGDDVLLAVSRRARGTPRLALRLLESIRRTATACGSNVLRIEDAQRTFELEGLDASGLDRLDREYLRALHEVGGPVRLNVLSARLMAPAQSITKLVETHLLRLGLVTKVEAGRTLTDRGVEYVRALTPDPPL
jgi:holliday junction DNA helicase RuvB